MKKVVILGSTGEAVMLSDEEQRDVLKTAIQTAAPQKVMIAGTGRESGADRERGRYIRSGTLMPSSPRPVTRTRRVSADSASLLARVASSPALSTGHCS